MPHICLQVSRDEVREAVLAGSLPPQLQAVAEKREAQQEAVRALVAAAAAGDEARLKVGGSRWQGGVLWVGRGAVVCCGSFSHGCFQYKCWWHILFPSSQSLLAERPDLLTEQIFDVHTGQHSAPWRWSAGLPCLDARFKADPLDLLGPCTAVPSVACGAKPRLPGNASNASSSP